MASCGAPVGEVALGCGRWGGVPWALPWRDAGHSGPVMGGFLSWWVPFGVLSSLSFGAFWGPGGWLLEGHQFGVGAEGACVSHSGLGSVGLVVMHAGSGGGRPPGPPASVGVASLVSGFSHSRKGSCALCAGPARLAARAALRRRRASRLAAFFLAGVLVLVNQFSLAQPIVLQLIY